jgi:hypothetical protein
LSRDLSLVICFLRSGLMTYTGVKLLSTSTPRYAHGIFFSSAGMSLAPAGRSRTCPRLASTT